MKPATFGALVSATLYEKRFGPYFVSPVIAGLDPEGDAPYLCGMDSIGAIETAHDFMVAGTAPDSLYGMCESMWRPDMVRESGGRGVRSFSTPRAPLAAPFPSPILSSPSLSLSLSLSLFPLTGRRGPVRDRVPVPALRHRPGRPGRVGGGRVRHHARRVHRAHAQGADGLRRGQGGGRMGVGWSGGRGAQMWLSCFFFCIRFSGGGEDGARGARERWGSGAPLLTHENALPLRSPFAGPLVSSPTWPHTARPSRTPSRVLSVPHSTMPPTLAPGRVGCPASARPPPPHLRMRAPCRASVDLASSTAAAYPTAADVAPPTGPGQSHFLHIDDWSRERLDAVLATAATVKAKLAARDESFKPFAGKTMSMIFTKPSMRTRVSFETV